MFGDCCGCTKIAAFALTGVAGVAVGVVGSNALQDRATSDAESNAALELVSFLQPEMEMSPEQMMEFMKDWSATVEEHDVLESMTGTWDAETKFWMAPGEPTTGQGVSTAEMVLGGRFVTQHFTMPDMMGMPFEGMGAIGFDKAKGKYVNVWMDNFSTGFMTMEGEYNADTKTMVWKGMASTPMGEMPVKHLIKHVNDNKMIMEFWEPNPETGDLHRSGEITYTRRR